MVKCVSIIILTFTLCVWPYLEWFNYVFVSTWISCVFSSAILFIMFVLYTLHFTDKGIIYVLISDPSNTCSMTMSGVSSNAKILGKIPTTCGILLTDCNKPSLGI